MLRVFFRHDKRLHGEISRLIYRLVHDFATAAAGKPIRTAAVVVLQTAGAFSRWNPHWHSLFLEGGFDREGRFVHVPTVDLAKMSGCFRQRVIAFFLERKLLNERLARNMLDWTHSGFSVDASIRIPAGSAKTREALAQYIVRPPVSLQNLLVDAGLPKGFAQEKRAPEGPVQFYRTWMHFPDLYPAKDLKGPILNPGSEATELAPALLKLTCHVLLRDRNYIERIKRHYDMFKREIDQSAVEKSKLRKGTGQETGRDQSLVKAALNPGQARAVNSPDDTSNPMGGAISAFTDKYLDVLQNLEFAVVTTYKQRSTMTDYDVMRILEALIDGYQAETIGRPPRYTPATDVEQELMDCVRGMCEWRLGRRPLSDDDRLKGMKKPDPVSRDEIVACLKKILNSARKWNKSGGRRGYLDFVIQHIG
jgi:hypothetical protein